MRGGLRITGAIATSGRPQMNLDKHRMCISDFSFKRLAITDPAELRFGVAPKPLTTRQGLTIGGRAQPDAWYVEVDPDQASTLIPH